MKLFDILSDVLKVDDVLLVVKNSGAVSEIRSDSLGIRQKEKWITIGENDGPAHMHIDSELIKTAQFVEEQKPERISFSVRFFNDSQERVLGCFFTKMYDEQKNLKSDRKKLYDDLILKYGSDVISF